MALCWIGFVMLFFSFSSTQEYYSMPCYPAIAILLACAMTANREWIAKARAIGDGVLVVVCTLAMAAISFILANVWRLPTPGDISQALAQHPSEYTLSMGHMGDLTLSSFAYLRGPLILAGLACAIGFLGMVLLKRSMRFVAPALMMLLFFHAARVAMVAFDPYLSSRPLAKALNASPRGKLIVDDQYYTFASVFFYSDTKALLLNGRVNNLEYGSNAPDAPHVFITDADLPNLWDEPQRWYLVAEKPRFEKIERLAGRFTRVCDSRKRRQVPGKQSAGGTKCSFGPPARRRNPKSTYPGLGLYIRLARIHQAPLASPARFYKGRSSVAV